MKPQDCKSSNQTMGAGVRRRYATSKIAIKLALLIGTGAALAAVSVWTTHRNGSTAVGRFTPDGDLLAAEAFEEQPEPRFEDFVGATACARCHEKEYAL